VTAQVTGYAGAATAATALPVTGPLSGYRVVCVPDGPTAGTGRGAIAAARMLSDMGAEVVLSLAREPDGVEQHLLRPSATIRVEDAATLSDTAVGAFALVHQGRVEPELRARLAESGTNLVELLWVDDRPGSDLLAQAAAGTASIVGEPDREPLIYPHRLGEYLLGVNACGMVLHFALGERRGATGELYLSDIWAYATGTCGLLCTPKGIRYFREGRRSPGNGGVYPQRLFRARDGWIALLCRSSKEWDAIVRALGSPSWGEEPRYRDLLRMASEYPDEVDRLVEAETVRFTRAELFAQAIELGFPLAAVREPTETLRDEYLSRQGFWRDDLDGVRLPGPLWREQTWLPVPATATGTASGPVEPARALPRVDLRGLRVLDLSWVWAGPMVGSFLADLGSDVIKIEHGGRLDNMRLRGRLPSAIPLEHSDVDKREIDPLFHCANRGKRSLTLDLKHPRGRELFLQLVAASDVVLESFRPHVLRSWGLSFEELRGANPSIVLASLRGLELDESFGPSGLRSYAPITSSLAGLEATIGYPDQEGPTGGMGLGISDPVAGYHGMTLLLGALLHRKRTGRGGWVRLSQLETLTSVLPEMFLAAQGVPVIPPVGHTERRPEGDVAVAPDGTVWPVREVGDHERWPELFGRPVLAEVRHELIGKQSLYGHGWRIDGHPVLPTASAPIIGADTDDVLGEYLGIDQRRLAELRSTNVLS
jgi:crotonobetainyl-CoA:carnitine CoA-transferase CaiB-like acyl-CoA transferase